MSTYDRGARYACRVQPGVVARRLWRDVREPFAFADLHESKTNPLPGQRERIADMVLRMDNLQTPALPALAVLKFQSKHDDDKLRSTPVSVAHLHADARHDRGGDGCYLVFAGLIYLSGKPPRTTIHMTLTSKAGGEMIAGTNHQVLSWPHEDDGAAEALAEVEADLVQNWGLLFWVACMRGGATAENRAKWLELVRRVPSRRHQGDLGVITRSFAELTQSLREWEETLKEVNVAESQVFREMTAEADARAVVRTSREHLLRLARMKFKKKLKEEDVQMITTQDSPEVLSAWLDALFMNDNYTDFRKILRQ